MFVKLWWISSCTSFLTSWLHVSILTDHLQVFPLQMEAGTRCYKTAIRAATQLILQDFRRFTYVTAHSPTLPSLYLRHSSFSNPSVASPTSQLILHPSFASPTSQDFHLRHLASRPCWKLIFHHFYRDSCFPLYIFISSELIGGNASPPPVHPSVTPVTLDVTQHSPGSIHQRRQAIKRRTTQVEDQ